MVTTSNHTSRVLAAIGDAAEERPGQRIADSWRRCLIDHKLDPEQSGPPVTLTQTELKDRIGPLDEIIHLAAPELEDLYRALQAGSYCVNFADTRATMLVSRLPGDEAAAIFRRWKVYTGSMFEESVEGTNGLGTALAEQRPILVHRDEHFRQHWSTFTCAVVPMFDHVGQLAGAVNITSCRGDPDQATHRLALSVTMQAVRRIEQSIFRSRFSDCWIATLSDNHGGGCAMIAFDEDQRVRGASRAARQALGISDDMIGAGAVLSQFILTGDKVMRPTNAPQLIRRLDGQSLGYGRIASPLRVQSAVGMQSRASDFAGQRSAELTILVGNEPSLRHEVNRLMRVAGANIPVLLLGETGSGKDTLARAIHSASERRSGPYVALNCAAMPESLMDAELFGYEAGAFTGARRDGFKGLIVQASGGTLFLDEVGDMPLALQARLLRVLENREVRPLGALKPLPVDIRLISATHRDLEAMVAEGSFRADLYYRLRGLCVELPPLRRRADKADVIAKILVEEAPHARISPGALDVLMAYPFPGNMRQLRHVLRLAGCTAENGVIVEADLDLRSRRDALPIDLETAERNVIAQALRAHHGRVAAAARALKLSPATLYRKIKTLRIEVHARPRSARPR